MKCGILLAAFGAGNAQSAATLRTVQARAEERFHLPVRWAFTSEALRMRLAKEGSKSDSVFKALQRMRFDRYERVGVQSLHLIPGLEYEGVLDDVRRAEAEGAVDGGAGAGLMVRAGKPLLTSGADAEHAAVALLRHVPPERRAGEPVVCMAHGSAHEAETWYAAWGRAVHAQDPQVHVACMKGSVTLDTLLQGALTGAGPGRVWLLPLLSVVGKHTLYDMAGPQPASWKSRLEAAGFACAPVLRGLADGAAFVDLWLDRLAEAIAKSSPSLSDGKLPPAQAE